MDIQEKLTQFAMLGATWVMWLLVILSIICVAIILERAYYLVSTREDVESLRERLFAALRSGKRDDAKKILDGSRSFEARVVSAGLEVADDGTDAVETRMDGAAQISRLHMEKNLAFLGTVGNNAPFVGLLGTVIGIIRSFHELNSSGGKVTTGLMEEVGEALVATAIGILVALPAVAFFNMFQRVIKARVSRAQALGKELLAYLHGQRVSGRS